LLPALVVCVLAFVAAADKKSRERWGDLLYQVGSIRPDQREDPKIGRGVKWPFFIVAFGLLIWPLQFFRHASVVIDPTETDLKKGNPTSDFKKSGDEAKPEGTPNPTPTPGPAVHQLDSTGTSSSATSAQRSSSGDLRPAVPAAVAQPGSTSTGDLKPIPR
jgi:hypothetical protein